MAIQKDARLAVKLVRDAVHSRMADRRLSGRMNARTPFEPAHFKIAVYFADGPVNMYQMRQWYKPLLALSEIWPVVVLSRTAGGTMMLMEESPIPVAYVRRVSDLERLVDEQDIRIVLYVNQNPRNFQMMRYGSRWHVFINHGESDKMYMLTNQFKAYDYAFVAGDAAIGRLNRVLWDYDFDKRALPIGRPQADHFSRDVPYTPDERTVVLYAPTWEGDRPSAAYGSVATHGVALVTALLASGRHRVIYRPHPRSGVADHEYGVANRRIIAALAAANTRDASAQHVYDDGPDLGWQLVAADVAIVDISAMVYDRLATGKALFVTRPVNPAATIDTSGYLSDCEWLYAEQAADITTGLSALADDGSAQARLASWVTRYFGDTTPGTATARFHAAIEHLLREWDRFAVLHAGDDDAITPGAVGPNDAASSADEA